jgi:hypothetical protein
MGRLSTDERIAIIGISSGVILVLCDEKSDGVALVISCVGYLTGSNARKYDLNKGKENNENGESIERK